MLNDLLLLKDDGYAAFQRKLLPTLPPQSIIGVRTPELKALAKTMLKNGTADAFTAELPHVYFEENQLHAFIINEEKSFDKCIQKLEAFLPHVDNWATCDQLSPKAFAKARDRLLPYTKLWLASPLPFTVRFGIGTLMRHFLDDAFEVAYAERVAAVTSDEYYVNMMVAWYFATALAKQYGSVLPIIERRALPQWTHNKAIQKARESFRVTAEQKEYLQRLKY